MRTPSLFLCLPIVLSAAARTQALLPLPVTGDLLVSSSGSDRILRLTHDGQRIAEIALPGLSYPRGIAVGKDGSVYVVSKNTDEVLVLDRTLAFVRRFSTAAQASKPTGVAIGANGNLFVAGSFSNKVSEYQPDGTPVRDYVGHGLSAPEAIALMPDKSFYVTSGATGSVLKFDTSGNLSLAFTGFGLASPVGVAVWNSELFAAGSGSNNIAVFDLAGSTRRQLQNAQIAAPQEIAFTADGRLVTVSSTANKVSWFRPDGTWLTSAQPAGLSAPTGLAFLPGATVESSGSPKLGTSFPFAVVSPFDPGKLYVTMLALASSPGITLPDGRLLALAPDILFELSLSGNAWFPGFVGFLDATGTGRPALQFPVDPILVGLRIYGAAVTIDPAYPTAIAQVAPTVSWVLAQ